MSLGSNAEIKQFFIKIITFLYFVDFLSIKAPIIRHHGTTASTSGKTNSIGPINPI